MKKKNNILIFGYGRWGRIYIDYLKKYNYRIYIFSKQKIFDKNLYKNFNLISNEVSLKKLKFKKILIVNKTSDHLKSLNFFLKSKTPILLEKPLDYDIFNVKSKHIKNFIFLSLQFSFADYFFFLKKKLKKDSILKFEMIWNDKIGDKKNYNEKMHFIEDVFYHFFSILSIFFDPKFFLIKKTNNLNITKSKINFDVLNKKFFLKVKKNHIKKDRLLKITTLKNQYIVDFTKIDDNKIYCNNKIIKRFKNNQQLIKKQISFFIKGDDNLNKNKLTNLNVLISNLKEITKYLKIK